MYHIIHVPYRYLVPGSVIYVKLYSEYVLHTQPAGATTKQNTSKQAASRTICCAPKASRRVLLYRGRYEAQRSVQFFLKFSITKTQP